jgi:hypothetical protein
MDRPMNQLDIEITRYKQKLSNGMKRNLPMAVLQQYNNYLQKKLLEREDMLTMAMSK